MFSFMGNGGLRVAVIGSRNCTNLTVDDIMCELPPNTVQIISGGATGVDKLAQEVARQNGLTFRAFMPEYEKYGKLAPLKRNQILIQHADHVLAFWDFLSTGTAHAIACCVQSGIPVRVIGLGPKRSTS